MTKVNRINGNETKSNIFQWNIYKSVVISFFIKINFFFSFMTKVKPNHGNETKPDIFPWIIFKSVIFFHWSQNTTIFQ